MLSDVELETMQLVFSIEKEIVLMELREMMEKTIQLEKVIREKNHDFIDSYKPSPDIEYPAKKKVRLE